MAKTERLLLEQANKNIAAYIKGRELAIRDKEIIRVRFYSNGFELKFNKGPELRLLFNQEQEKPLLSLIEKMAQSDVNVGVNFIKFCDLALSKYNKLESKITDLIRQVEKACGNEIQLDTVPDFRYVKDPETVKLVMQDALSKFKENNSAPLNELVRAWANQEFIPKGQERLAESVEPIYLRHRRWGPSVNLVDHQVPDRGPSTVTEQAFKSSLVRRVLQRS